MWFFSMTVYFNCVNSSHVWMCLLSRYCQFICLDLDICLIIINLTSSWARKHTFKSFEMPLVKLTVQIKSYWICQRFSTVYFDGITVDNLIFDNKLLEEKHTRVKISYVTKNREALLLKIHQPDSSWIVDFVIDPTCSTLSKDKDGNKLTCFKSENADTNCWCVAAGL